MKFKLLFSFALFSSLSFGQVKGFIEYNIQVKGLTPELNKGAALLTNNHMRVSFIDSALRQDYVFGEYSKKTTILNYKVNQGIFYEDGPNGKYGVFGTCDQINQLVVIDTNQTLELTKEKKVILTFPCKKAVLTLSTGEKVDYWYTTEFPVQLPSFGFFNPKIPGVILEFSTTSNGFFMSFKCSNYGTELENIEQLFEPKITRDYKMIEFNSYMYYIYMQKQLQNQPK